MFNLIFCINNVKIVIGKCFSVSFWQEYVQKIKRRVLDTQQYSLSKSSGDSLCFYDRIFPINFPWVDFNDVARSGHLKFLWQFHL